MGIRTYDSEVSQSTASQTDTLERSSKRRRIGSSPPSSLTMDVWGVSTDDPAAMFSSVPIDPWIVSELGLQAPPDDFTPAERAETVNHAPDIGNGKFGRTLPATVFAWRWHELSLLNTAQWPCLATDSQADKQNVNKDPAFQICYNKTQLAAFLPV